MVDVGNLTPMSAYISSRKANRGKIWETTNGNRHNSELLIFSLKIIAQKKLHSV